MFSRRTFATNISNVSEGQKRSSWELVRQVDVSRATLPCADASLRISSTSTDCAGLVLRNAVASANSPVVELIYHAGKCRIVVQSRTNRKIFSVMHVVFGYRRMDLPIVFEAKFHRHP
jgi:hypothetical protein